MKSLSKTELHEIMARGYAARQELQDRDDAALNAQNANLIGAFQKFRNSYGAGDPDRDWWLYRRIDSINGSWCTALKFQVMIPEGRIEIEIDRKGSLSESWQTIPRAEFDEAWQGLLSKITSAHTSSAEPKC